ncbi:hypothetical protein M0802_006839 [Mischocyttarus mexicanus]|nr:hypothetical protein M0802_006839 [Mischocyttarus mexicanus]
MVMVMVMAMMVMVVVENEYKKRWWRWWRRESACQSQACTEVAAASVGTVGYAHINPDLPSSSTRYNYLRRPVTVIKQATSQSESNTSTLVVQNDSVQKLDDDALELLPVCCWWCYCSW